MKFGKLARWIGLAALLLMLSLVFALTAVKITEIQEQKAVATQQALQFSIEQTQTAEALEKEMAEFSKNITLLAHLEDCTASEICDTWANKVLIIYVVNKNHKNIRVEWNSTDLSCKERTSDEIDPNGGSGIFRCSAFYKPSLDSIDYIRNACMTFSASIVNSDDAQAEICSDVSNMSFLKE